MRPETILNAFDATCLKLGGAEFGTCEFELLLRRSRAFRDRILRMFNNLEKARDFYRECAGYAINDRIQAECLHEGEWFTSEELYPLQICMDCGLAKEILPLSSSNKTTEITWSLR